MQTPYAIHFPSSRLLSANCIVCEHKVDSVWLTRCRDLYLHAPHIVDYGQCSKCRLIQQVPIPGDTQSFYPINYPMHHSRGSLVFLARKLMIRGIYYKPDYKDKGCVLMDFGCGDGSYLQSIRNRVGRRLGFEPSPKHAMNVQQEVGCNVYSNPSEMADDLKEKVDIITAHFVLEHLSDLHETFRLWNRLLKPGGNARISHPKASVRCFSKHMGSKSGFATLGRLSARLLPGIYASRFCSCMPVPTSYVNLSTKNESGSTQS